LQETGKPGLAQARHATARASGPLERSRLGTAQLLRQTGEEKRALGPFNVATCNSIHIWALFRLSFFTLYPSHQIFESMHGVLNVDKKITNYTV